MKLWNKDDILDKKIEKFTVGKDRINDLYLAKYDVKASIAHAKMLNKVGVLKSNELKLLEYELNQIKQVFCNVFFVMSAQTKKTLQKTSFI